MSEEFHDWLTDLRTHDLPAARLVGEAVIALLDEGPGLGPPLVVAVGSTLEARDPAAALDQSYRHQLELLQRIRRGVADIATSRKRLELQIDSLEARADKLATQGERAAASGVDGLAEQVRMYEAVARDELADLRGLLLDRQAEEERATLAAQRVQAKVEAFRIRKEAVKDTYIAGRAQADIEEVLTEIGEGDGSVSDTDEVIAAARSAAESLRDGAKELEREALAAGGTPPGRPENSADLHELRLAALTGQDVRLLFVITPPNTVVLLAAGDRSQWRGPTPPSEDEALSAAYSKQSFLDAFFPDDAPEMTAGAARLIARNRVWPLTKLRRRSGLTRAQVAGHMNVQEERVAAVEHAEPGATDIPALAAYVRALGGRLEVVADFGTERVVLKPADEYDSRRS
ncbi:PspA/IM30 family protein [Actinomadura rubrisoli]|uniref:Helix-turn-helix domain-containing protein n=1 Tax=Actinomadura rubrisoli TaxID=2530368 RepID=A0A4R5BKP1_9ACTN|nr:hypothetical protein [Actinomadura rubrisoli]TDD85933.1 hypothetical protein E1298_18100 [Actinomadura rubrisoli]